MPKRRSLTELRDLALEKEAQPDPEAQSPGAQPRARERSPAAKRNKWVQLNVFVPEALRQELKMRALREKRDMSDIVAELLKTYLGE